MAKSVGALFVTLGIQANEYQRGLAAAERQASKSMRAISREFRSLDLRGAAIGVGAFATGIVLIGKRFADAGVEAERNQRKFEAIFGTLARSSETWVNTFSAAVGRSRDDMQGFMSQFDIILTNLGVGAERAAEMSRELTRAGVDLASFMGAQDPDTMQAFSMALAGNTRGLRQYGIVIKQNMIEEAAERAGFEERVSNLTDAQRAQLYYNEIIRQTTFVQGDAVRRGGEYDNQMKRLRANIHDAAQEIGTRMLPAMSGMIQKLNAWISTEENQQRILDWAQKTTKGMEEIGKAADGIVKHRGAIEAAFWAMFGMVTVNWIVKTAGSIIIVTRNLKTLAALMGLGLPTITVPIVYTVAAGAGLLKYKGEKPPTMELFGRSSLDAKGFVKPKPEPVIHPDFEKMPDPLGLRKIFAVPDIGPDFKDAVAKTNAAGEEIKGITAKQQKALDALRREGMQYRISLLREEDSIAISEMEKYGVTSRNLQTGILNYESGARVKRMAEIEDWYRQEIDKAGNNRDMIIEIEKQKGERLTAFDDWWTEQLIGAAQSRSKRLLEIQQRLADDSLKVEARRIQQEFSRTAATGAIEQRYNLTGTETDTYKRQLAGFEKEKALEKQRWEWEKVALERQYGATAEGYSIMESAATIHYQRIQTIDQEATQAMMDSSLAFASYWGDMLLSVVEQSGNSFNNVGRMFDQMIKKMAIKAAIYGVLNVISGGTFAAGAKAALMIPGLASGGDVRAGKPYIVGEKQPELFVPKTPGTILPKVPEIISFPAPAPAPVVNMKAAPAPVVNVKVPSTPAPVVNVKVPSTPAPMVNMKAAPAPAPVVNVKVPSAPAAPGLAPMVNMKAAPAPASVVNVKAAIGLPGLAAGGLVTQPTVAMLGERGPESVLDTMQTREHDRGIGKTFVYHDNSSLAIHIAGNTETLTVENIAETVDRVIRERRSREFEKFRRKAG